MVEVREGLGVGQAREGDELVGVEGRPDDRDPLQHLPGQRIDAADHRGVEHLDPRRLRGRPAGQLGHRERHATGDGGDLLDQLVVGLGDVATDQAGHRLLVEGSQLGHHRTLARHEALTHLQERRTDGVEAVRHHQGHAVVRRGPGEVVQEAQAGLVGIVDVVDGEQQPLPRRRQPDELGGGHEEPLVAPIPAPGHLPARRAPGRSRPGRSPRGRRGGRRGGGRRRRAPRARAHRATTPPPRPPHPARPGSPARSPAGGLGPAASTSRCRAIPSRTTPGRDPRPPRPSVRPSAACSASRPTSSSSGRRRTGAPAKRLVAERDRRRTRSHAELAAQLAVHALELAEHGVAVAGGEVLLHELDVGLLVARLDLDQGVPATGQAEQLDVPQPQVLTTLLGPVLVAILRQQLAPVAVDRRAARRRDRRRPGPAAPAPRSG